jgi:hypothetical protein
MKFLFHLTTTLFLAITARGATSTGKTVINDRRTNGYASMDYDCISYGVIFAAHEIVTKLNGSPTTIKAANVTVRMGSIPGCGDSSYIETLFEMKTPQLKSSITNGATLSVRSSQGTGKSCSSLPEDLCEEEPLSVSFSVVLTPNGGVFRDQVVTRDSTGTRVRYSRNIVEAISDYSGTFIDGVPFIPDFSFADISKYTSQTV